MNRMAEPIVIHRLIQWANARESIEAMLLYSSRTDPAAPVDIFSDYDLLIAVTDIHPFHSDDRWLEDFGEVLVVFRNPIGVEYGFECFGFITHYRDGTKIDYGFFPVDFMRWIAQQPKLPEDLDHGYKVLVDKDRLTENFPLPTYSAYLPHPPTAQEYRAIVEEFFNDALYVAKHLWRDDLFPVKLSLDHIMKFQCLRKMMEWRIAIDQNWGVKPGAVGKGLKEQACPLLWTELGATYVGVGKEENWGALFRTIGLFRKVACEVADRLGYPYPSDIDQNVIATLKSVKGLQDNDGRL